MKGDGVRVKKMGGGINGRSQKNIYVFGQGILK